ncbi:hypothetical protein HHI36_006590 [Cryptolaemus montrouzieri]|uniref:Uncharacterized protein n=1 Tax=Cryptolaemus montrouzieri TaxID=559131 RepID=A0ABD2NYX2_9CUCU
MADRTRKFNLNNPKDIDEMQKLLWDEEEEDEIESTNFQENQTYYMGRNKETKWFFSAFPEGRRQAHNITKRLPGAYAIRMLESTCVR